MIYECQNCLDLFEGPKPCRLFNEFVLGDSLTWDSVSLERFETETDIRKPL